MVVNMAFYKGYWDEIGFVLFSFVECCLMSPWNCDGLYSNIEDQFFNVLVGYYILLLNMMLKEEHCQDPFQDNLAKLTIINTFANVGNFIARCRYHPSELPFRLRKQMEWGIEPWFGECKKGNRGMGRLRDLLLGTCCYHSKGFRVQGVGFRGQGRKKLKLCQ